jgi:hypothetical protein
MQRCGPPLPLRRSCELVAPFLCEIRPPGQTAYESSSGANFVYSTAALPFAEAQRSCGAVGGHLAYYSSLVEQTEVRRCAARRGAAAQLWSAAARC